MIVVHAKGNNQIGIGNLSRCYELINYLSKKHKVLGIFECNKYLFTKYSQNNIIRSINIDYSLQQIKKQKNVFYICDLVNPNKTLSDKLKRIGVKKIFYFNRLENGFEPDIFFLTDDFNYSFKKNGFELYRGFKYYIVGKDIINHRPTKFTQKKQIKNALICFGGADPAFFTEQLLQEIEDTKYNYTIILGPAMSKERKESIKNIKKENVSYVDSPSNVVAHYNNNDLLISLGGMMTYEAMCLGLPVCGIRWQYLSYIVKSFGEKNMINDLGDIEDAYKNILNLNINNINQIAENAFKIIDGKALENIQKTIEKYL